MAPRKSPKSGSPSPGARREAKHGGNKSGKKEGASGSSFFTWFMVIALLGVWTSVAVVWFELVDYEEVLGKLGLHDADGDGDFDLEDAKVLLGLKEKSVPGQSVPRSAEEMIQSAEKPHTRTEHVKTEVEDEIESLLHEVLESELEKSEVDEDHEETHFQEDQEKEITEVSKDTGESYVEEIVDKIPEDLEKETLGSIQEEPTNHHHSEDTEEDDIDVSNKYNSNVEEDTFEPENPESFSESREKHDYADEIELETEDYIETQDADKANVPHSITEPIKSESPIQAEEYSDDDLIDT